MHYIDEGPADGRSPSCSAACRRGVLYRTVIAAMREAGYRCIAPDHIRLRPQRQGHRRPLVQHCSPHRQPDCPYTGTRPSRYHRVRAGLGRPYRTGSERDVFGVEAADIKGIEWIQVGGIHPRLLVACHSWLANGCGGQVTYDATREDVQRLEGKLDRIVESLPSPPRDRSLLADRASPSRALPLPRAAQARTIGWWPQK
jgi:hypothetical protein